VKIAVAFFFFALTEAARAEICDLQVLVRDYEGRPVDPKVTVVGADGRTIAETVAKGGRAEFCDLGLATVSVIVGGDHCGQVQVRRLKITAGHTITIPVYFRNCHSFTVFDSCDILVRLVDQKGTKLPGASVAVGGRVYVSDRFGRVRFGLGRTTQLELIASYGELEKERLTVSCGPNSSDVEKTIILKQNVNQAVR
jgi:hypothetical protein